MSKQCRNCGAELPEDASFCPYCTHSQIERTEAPPPRLWRKKALIAALVLVLLAAAALAWLLPHRPKTYEGGASVTYQDKDGTYTLLVTTFIDDLAAGIPEEKRTLTAAAGGKFQLPALLGVLQDGKPVDAKAFLAKVERAELEAVPNENGALDVNAPVNSEAFAPALLESDVIYTSASGTNDLVWTLTMKNGDTIRLTQTYEIIELVHQAYTANDAPMDTIEELETLLSRIEEEVPADTIVDLYLPPVTYTGDLTIASRAVNLHGCADGTGRTVFEGSLSVQTHEPDEVKLSDLDFVGSGGVGLRASASTYICGCSFTGWDIGAQVKNGGMIAVDASAFRDNGIGFQYDTVEYYSYKDTVPDSRFEGNDIGVQILNLPGGIPLGFTNTEFTGNGTDVDNQSNHPVDLSGAIRK